MKKIILTHFFAVMFALTGAAAAPITNVIPLLQVPVTTTLKSTNLLVVGLYAQSNQTRVISFSHFIDSLMMEGNFMGGMSSNVIAQANGSGTNTSLVTPTITSGTLTAPISTNLTNTGGQSVGQLLKSSVATNTAVLHATNATTAALQDYSALALDSSYTARMMTISNLASVLLTAPYAATVGATGAIVRAETWGNNHLASNFWGYPFAHPTNAWNYMVDRGSNDWTLVIGDNLWTVNPGYVSAGGRAGFHTYGGLRNVKVTGKSKNATVISNATWGDVFTTGTNSSGVEIGNMSFHQPRTGVFPIVTNGILSNVNSSIISGPSDNVTLSTNIWLHDLEMRNVQDLGVYLHAHNVLAERVNIQGLGTTNLFTNHQPDGAGITGSGSDWIIRDCTMLDCHYCIEVGGHPGGGRTNRNYLISGVNCTAWNIGFALFPAAVAHAQGGNRFENVRFVNCTAASVPGYTNVAVSLPRDGPLSKGFELGGNAAYVSVEGCTVRNAVTGIRTISDPGSLTDVRLVGNHIAVDYGPLYNDTTVSYQGIWALPDTGDTFDDFNLENFIIAGNIIDNCRTFGIAAAGTNGVIRDNMIVNSGFHTANGSALRIYDGDYNASFKRVGNMWWEDNVLVAGPSGMPYGILYGTTLTNIVFRNNRQVGGTDKLKIFGTPAIYTNTTWNAAYGLYSTNVSFNTPY